VDGCRRDTVGAEPIHLILHERNERRYDDGRSVEQERWELEAERFARACGHHGNDVLPLEHSASRLELARTEFGKAEAIVQETVE
jgi:hypothetical protein